MENLLFLLCRRSRESKNKGNLLTYIFNSYNIESKVTAIPPARRQWGVRKSIERQPI